MPELKSGAAWLASAAPEEVDEFLGGLSQNALLALPWVFEFWALPHQLPPRGAWKTWVIMGGRGAGKTRAGSEWVRAQVEGAGPEDTGKCKRVALVGETIDQVRDVMVLGESGIIACSPPDRKPEWLASKNQLLWPNGAMAQVFSAHEPEAMRGPQFDAAWADELGKWKKGGEAWDQLQFALRLGRSPQAVVTTTPRNVGVLKAILKNPSSVITHAPTEANRAYLAESFLAEVQARYGGTKFGRQELEGLLIEEADGALWTSAMLEAARVDQVPQVNRIVVAVDPPVTSTKSSDECGIVVVGADTRGAKGLARGGAGGCLGKWRLARRLGAGGAGGDGAARGGPAGGRGEPGRRSGGAAGADDRPAGAVSGRPCDAVEDAAGRAGGGFV